MNRNLCINDRYCCNCKFCDDFGVCSFWEKAVSMIDWCINYKQKGGAE